MAHSKNNLCKRLLVVYRDKSPADHQSRALAFFDTGWSCWGHAQEHLGHALAKLYSSSLYGLNLAIILPSKVNKIAKKDQDLALCTFPD